MNKLEHKLLMEASFFDRMYADVIRALFRPAAKKFFDKIANDINTDPEVAAMFQHMVDSKREYDAWKKEMEKKYPDLKGKLD